MLNIKWAIGCGVGGDRWKTGCSLLRSARCEPVTI